MAKSLRDRTAKARSTTSKTTKTAKKRSTAPARAKTVERRSMRRTAPKTAKKRSTRQTTSKAELAPPYITTDAERAVLHDEGYCWGRALQAAYDQVAESDPSFDREAAELDVMAKLDAPIAEHLTLLRAWTDDGLDVREDTDEVGITSLIVGFLVGLTER